VRVAFDVTPLALGFSLTRGPDGSIWATTRAATDDGAVSRDTPGRFAD
jgi:hypothetical protein